MVRRARSWSTLLDSVWGSLSFDSPWIAARERVEAHAAIDRLLAWHRARPERDVVATELDFEVTVPLEGAEAVQLRGSGRPARAG